MGETLHIDGMNVGKVVDVHAIDEVIHAYPLCGGTALPKNPPLVVMPVRDVLYTIVISGRWLIGLG